jgi:hypothetical protein
MFCDLADSTVLAGRLDAEDLLPGLAGGARERRSASRAPAQRLVVGSTCASSLCDTGIAHGAVLFGGGGGYSDRWMLMVTRSSRES